MTGSSRTDYAVLSSTLSGLVSIPERICEICNMGERAVVSCHPDTYSTDDWFIPVGSPTESGQTVVHRNGRVGAHNDPGSVPADDRQCRQ